MTGCSQVKDKLKLVSKVLGDQSLLSKTKSTTFWGDSDTIPTSWGRSLSARKPTKKIPGYRDLLIFPSRP